MKTVRDMVHEQEATLKSLQIVEDSIERSCEENWSFEEENEDDDTTTNEFSLME